MAVRCFDGSKWVVWSSLNVSELVPRVCDCAVASVTMLCMVLDVMVEIVIFVFEVPRCVRLRSRVLAVLLRKKKKQDDTRLINRKQGQHHDPLLKSLVDGWSFFTCPIRDPSK